MTDSSSQKYEVLYKMTLTMVGSILVFMLSWGTLDPFSDDRGIEIMWVGIFLFTLSLLHGLFRMVMAGKSTRAYQFHLSMLIQAVLISLILFDAALKIINFAVYISPIQQNLLIVISLLLAFFGFYTGAQIDRDKLRNAFQYNLDSGRLDLSNRKWDLDKTCTSSEEMGHLDM